MSTRTYLNGNSFNISLGDDICVSPQDDMTDPEKVSLYIVYSTQQYYGLLDNWLVLSQWNESQDTQKMSNIVIALLSTLRDVLSQHYDLHLNFEQILEFSEQKDYQIFSHVRHFFFWISSRGLSGDTLAIARSITY